MRRATWSTNGGSTAATWSIAVQPASRRGWTDTRPWADPVERALQIAARVASDSGWQQTFVFIREDGLPDEVTSVVIGWDGDRFQREPAPAFHVVAAAGELVSERWRASWDDQTSPATRARSARC